MRDSCTDCCRKHLAQAMVLILEANKGYPLHAWLAVGHMAEAEDEMLERYPEIANDIRNQRLKLMETMREGKPAAPALMDLIELVCDTDTQQTMEVEVPDEFDNTLHDQDMDG